jgi:hypothetical protein
MAVIANDLLMDVDVCVHTWIKQDTEQDDCFQVCIYSIWMFVYYAISAYVFTQVSFLCSSLRLVLNKDTI